MRKFTTWMAGKLIRKINAAAAQQRGPVDELHHEIVGPDIVYHANVRMAQRSHCAHLAIEPLAELFMGKFQGDIAAHARIMGAIYLSHAARADGRKDLISGPKRLPAARDILSNNSTSPCGVSHRTGFRLENP